MHSLLPKLAMPVLLLVSAGNIANAQTETSVEKGARLFVICQSCHTISPSVESLFGPSLHKLFGRPAGSLAGYPYSEAMVSAGKNGMLWNDLTLNDFLASPKSAIPGTRMSLEGFTNHQDRSSLISYLKKVYSPGAPGVVVRDDPPVPTDVMSLAVDAEYGQYLASECLSCHQADGKNEGIPAITGWSPQRFVMVMRSYKQKVRSNPVMQTVAGALGDEELVSLAGYFEALK